MSSPFTSAPRLAENRSAFVIADKFPVSPGHLLIVPHRLISTWWEASPEERSDLLQLLEEMRLRLLDERSPQGFNIGINEGAAAGQTVHHLHIHLIPRYDGDMDDPRGGVRHVIPSRGNYLVAGEAPSSGEVRLIDGSTVRLRAELEEALASRHLDRVDLVVSFIMQSGMRLIHGHLSDALDRGAQVRVLTTDYLGVTHADALATLLDLEESAREAGAGSLTTRVFTAGPLSFHPKAYLFRSSSPQARGIAFVGSSNLSQSGIDGGVEWNLAVTEVEPLAAAFEVLWRDERTIPLDHDWIRTYRNAPPRPPEASLLDSPVAEIGQLAEPVVQPVTPRPIQVEALEALAATRLAGHRAGLVVMATGLGKTWVAAFDSGRPEFGRTLFVAHRDEILQQSRDAFRQVRPDGELGLYHGTAKQPDADVVFASVQTLTNRLHEFEPDDFDFIVIDEFHHAAARSYRRVINYFEPAFLLGLTATPDRTDGADLLALCGDNLVYECDLVEGIGRRELVPFRYFGIADVVDYAPIPWRSGRFVTEQLTEAVETQERAEHAFANWQERAGARTLAFCVTTSHADFMADWFRSRGVRAVAVHSGPSSAPRRQSVEDLASGEIDVVFAVDIFNEGFDLPVIDTVLMLRPTESPVVFLQQLGRGLRLSEGKDALVVIDFIGNHRSFLLKPRVLSSLGSGRDLGNVGLQRAIEDPANLGLPEGCSVTWDLTAIDFFAELLQVRGKATDALVEFIEDHVAETGSRPTAIQAFRAGLNPDSVKSPGRWFELLADLGVLADGELAAQRSVGAVLAQIQKEPLSKSYKLVTLQALLHDDAAHAGMSIDRLVTLASRIVLADPRLCEDATSDSFVPSAATDQEWRAFWERNPIAAFTRAGKRSGDALFVVDGDEFRPTFRVEPAVADSFGDLLSELVEYRLARYLLRPGAETETMTFRVSNSSGSPILRFDREQYPDCPEGWTEVVADGQLYELNFVKIAVNVARVNGEEGNALHELLRRWFGPTAGQPGTHHEVTLRREGRWTLAPRITQSSQVRRFSVNGEEIDASVTIRAADDHTLSVTLESSGGKKGTPSARNLDYVRGFDLILDRAERLGIEISDVYLDSERARGLTIEERRLDDSVSLPVRWTDVTDHESLRKAFLSAMGKKGRAPGITSSGNQRKRVTFVMSTGDRPAESLLDPLLDGDWSSGARLEVVAGVPDSGPELCEPSG